MTTSTISPLLLDGEFRADPNPVGSFSAFNPASGARSSEAFPVSGPETLRALLRASQEAADQLARVTPDQIAQFLELCAAGLEQQRSALVAAAHEETGLPIEPRLTSVELPRTQNQLRLAARAVRERSFTEPVLDPAAGIRSMRGPLGGPVLIFGPNNFPFAFNACMGGDFAAAIAAGNPVIAKGHPCHPKTTRLLAAVALEALRTAGLPQATVQMLYAMPDAEGLAMVADPAIAAVAFTGSRRAGLKLKAAADSAGKPIYVELAALNPVVILPGALSERGAAIAQELAGSITLGCGQFCTKPGLSISIGAQARDFTQSLLTALGGKPGGPLLSEGSAATLQGLVQRCVAAGADLLCGGRPGPGPGFAFEPTLLRVTAEQFLAQAAALQHEAFGPVHLTVEARSEAEALAVCQAFEGGLTASLYTAQSAADDAFYAQLAPVLRRRVGRLLNDRMPTGVAVSPAMNHGGPFPATGHPGFTAVGMPGAIQRFTALHCYDQVRPARLPLELQDANPLGIWRRIDGNWSRGAHSA